MTNPTIPNKPNIPGTLTAAAAAAAYEKVGANRQSISDHSGNGNALQVGSAAGVDTNDPSHLIESYNLLTPGSSEDLTHADWTTEIGATVVDATNLTFVTQHDAVQQDVTTLEGESYTFRITARVTSGATDLHLHHENSATGDETAITLTGTLAEYSVTVLGRTGGGAVSFGLEAHGTPAAASVNITEWAVYRGNVVHPHRSSSEPIFVGAHCDYDGVDNYCKADYSAIGAGSVIVLARQDARSTNGTFWASGTSATEVFTNTSGDLFIRSTSNLQATSVDIDLGLYSIYVFTFDGGTGGIIYKDASSTVVTFSATAEVGTNIRIGGDVQNNNDFFNGSIPLVAVYSRVLSASEITKITKQIAQEFWDYRGIACLGVSGVDYTVAPANL